LELEKNGLDLTGPIAYSTKAETLLLNSIKAGGIVPESVPDGYKGKALRSSGS
jgi:hypothetical protein